MVEASELVKKMEEKFQISAAPVAVATATEEANSDVSAVSEKSEFTIFLESFQGDKKVDAIKKVREVSGLPLMDAKKLVESGKSAIKENVPKEEAETIKKDLESLGAKILLQ